ncbi:S9 family peptidase [Gaoshiqia sediminis]|uniref:Prolyl oligopeptidase family serine peptidase n=1 Tax=Gaoshiqia sediminis TaxID=2986998 RepID=A0AA42C8J4_9BACT|nr:alpha/beta fold hydrolase [Gaoshiqia sediminis]MCW0481292.1 prolyl oligopeptidase family serine peptidase [Gaoshiqia sediminis]
MRKSLFLAILAISGACSQVEQKAPQQYSIEQFYQNTRYSGGAFSPDETRLLVSSDETGIFNLYEISIADGSKKQVTFSDKETFFAIDYVPGTDQLLYSADKGGNEINHIYLLHPDGTTVDLTPDENEKAGFGGWNDDKTAMFYISNKRDPKFFDLYKMPVADWKAEMIYQNDKGMDVSGLSHDEKTLALTKTETTSENHLYLYDLASKQMTEITDGPGNYQSSGFSKDDTYFYYITDAGKEFAYLVQYEMATGQKQVLFETNWDVMYSYLSENDKYRVIAINEDGKNNLIVRNNDTGEAVNFPQIPDGDIVGVSISDSEKLIRLTIGTSKAPNDIYVYDLQTAELKKLTSSLNPEINPEDLVSAEVVRYPSFDGLEIPAIYYKPLTASPKNKVPALVWVHGGPGGQSRVGYFALLQYLVNHGYAVLAVNNRGSSGYGKTFYKMDDRNHGDKDLKDCIWGKKWLQEQDYIDTEKIGIIGGSYGGYMTMAAMTFTPDEFKVGVNIFGVTNWLRTLKSIPPYWESFRKALYTELGDPFTEDSVRLYNISPLFHAHEVKNPVMVLQGANDPRVLQVESDEIVAAVKNNNVPVEYVVFPDEGHGFIKKENEIKGYGDILKFLNKYLKEIPEETPATE